MLPGDPNLPPGVNEDRDISYPDPVECEHCFDGQYEVTPCCNAAFIENADDWHCIRCGEHYESQKCDECKGKGVVSA